MKVGILGNTGRAQVWEKHLRPLKAVREVVISSSISDMKGSTCCILIDDTEHNLDLLAETIRLGIHTYLVAEIPMDQKKLKQIHSLSQESDVRVQFSHWPSLTPATQWMRSQLPKPDFIQITRETAYHTFTENRKKLRRYWMDEVAWIVKWMGIRVHRIEADELTRLIPGTGIRIYLKFENGASACIFHFTSGDGNVHRRVASGASLILDCDVPQQKVRRLDLGGDTHLKAQTKKFESGGVAGNSALHFFKAVRLGGETSFTPFDALQTSSIIQRVESHLRITR